MPTFNLMTNQQNVTLASGKSYRMRFDFRMLAEVENAYLAQYGRRMDVPAFIAELSAGSTIAIAIGAYAAMISAGLKLGWDIFWNEIFTFDNYDALRDGVVAGVSGMMPEPQETGEEHEKN